MESFVQEFLEFFDEAPMGTVRALASRILLKCRQITQAEAGTVFIVRGRGADRRLEAVVSQNDAVRASRRVFVIPYDTHSIAGYAAIRGGTVRIDDVDGLPADSPFGFDRSFDRKTGYHTRSILSFALTIPENKAVGVVQLINRIEGGVAVAFPERFERMAAPVSNLVGRIVERMVATEALARRNLELIKSNRLLRLERARVAALSEETERAFRMATDLLARAAEKYDHETGQHVKRVSEYCFLLAKMAGLEKAFCDEIRWASALHDVGKMSVEHAVLNKKGRLDDREFAEMQRHAEYGYQILLGYPKLAMAADIAYAHHEMWSGGGYPRHLAGEAIPLAARFVAIADVYDALRSTRPYKPGFSHERTVEIILNGDDRLRPEQHFDPAILAIFAKHHRRFDHIWNGFQHLPSDAAPPSIAAA